ncbi:GAF domain-containing protein [Salinirubellus salinus]|uniref:histidine kinase n=1 Tax=Salinirubellus salinus TaxID=1364945 RepID=A0A9E7R267_9EURY|nr:GAF domain-containing protein [Salinirubellus salinus]UWM54267.1 GAF domain-containing protein [Salinirubellus salinus]
MGGHEPDVGPRSWPAGPLDERRAWWELDVEASSLELQQDTSAPTLLGYDVGRFDADSPYLELVHPDDRTLVEEAIAAHIRGERENYEARYRVRAADGEYRHVHAVGRATGWDADGRVTRVAGVLTDVTPRVEHERKLELLRERSQRLMRTRSREEAAKVAVDTADEVIGAPLSSVHLRSASGDRLAATAVVDAVDEIFGEPPVYERDAPSGSRSRVVWDVFESGDPLFLPDVSAHEPLEEGTPAGCVLIHPLGDHGVFIVSAPEPDAFDETERTLVDLLASSLTTSLDRAEREERLRDRERRLERLHEATRDLIRAESSDAVAERVAMAARDVIGFEIAMVRFYDESAGGLVPVAGTASVAELLPERPVFTPESGSLNWEAYESGETRVHDDISDLDVAVDSETGIRSLVIVPLGEYGTLAAADPAPAAFDETDLFLARILATSGEAALEAAERAGELRARRDELERQNERLDEFASVVSHDLRNPLSVLKGSLEIAAETGGQAHVDRALDAVGRMEGLIDDLLTLSRAGESVDERERVALAPLVERSIESVPGPLTADVTVDEDRVLLADTGRLGQLLENLLRNAAEHGSTNAAGADPVRVTVGLLPGGDGFYVADDGPGIQPRERDLVFEHGYSTTDGGTGFGLHIVQRIAEAHGWTVSVTESEPGGARFEVRGVDSLE